MEVTRLSKRNHYEEIAEQLKRLIIEGKLKVGDKLPSTKEMSEQFGVGRSTMREALSALKAMGYIEIKQGGGCTVISSSPAEVELPELQSLRMNRETLLELLEARQSLEVSNAAIAAVKATDDDLAALHRIMQEMKASVGNDSEGERTDVLFHAALANATHNSILVRMFDSIVSQLEMTIREIRRVEIYANRSVAERLYLEHLAIYEAVSSRNADMAGERMKQHLEHVVSNLMKHL
ncbi:FadR/GntR family transcriptional regulator [Paenibacillus montanisoli]|uniref:GntR family transcriptional regulator n=1 Tax=Paenibacillus montanisoli TaxID=2081970 RepID=A0A328U4W9_9BACL|nr:FadR/GntR family transcriptional regulator [Paenibacillus montanisoli]RAP77640.1 GntR family transcriptional regulator [Paenibacillus montanisoli]